MDKTKLTAWLALGGRRIGLGDWRPEKSGVFGRLDVEEVIELADAAAAAESPRRSRRPGPRTRPGWSSRRPARASGCARRRDRGPIRRPWRRPRRRGRPGDRRSRCGHTRGPAAGGSRSPSTIPDGGTSAGPRKLRAMVRPSMWTGCTSTPFRRSSSETRATLARRAPTGTWGGNQGSAGFLRGRARDVETHQVEQLVVGQLSEADLAVAVLSVHPPTVFSPRASARSRRRCPTAAIPRWP